MKKLLSLIVLGALLTSCAPQLSPKYLNGFWYVEQDTCVKYTFIGQCTMFIDNECEGDKYMYHLKNDTLIFMPNFDTEVYGDSVCADTMVFKVLSDDYLDVTYLDLHFNLIRMKK